MAQQHRILEASTLSAALSKSSALRAVLEEHRSVRNRSLEKVGPVMKGRLVATNKRPGAPRREGERKASNLAVSNCDGSFYIVNVTIGGQSLPVIIDTGSSDLWVDSSLCDGTYAHLPALADTTPPGHLLSDQ